ncbi:MAG: hypothetical protein HWN65_00425 [Candidatus Helarchaeota archaeon]|nr:hypothetical protein [Candidatus Helarchaeota archaeon]
MPCQACGTEKTTAKCIICEIELCAECVVNCKLSSLDVCDQKAGKVVIYHCLGTFCKIHAKGELNFTCKGCKTVFCKTAIYDWAKACPTCMDYICGNCYKSHVESCTDFYDKETALEKVFKLVEGDKGDKKLNTVVANYRSGGGSEGNIKKSKTKKKKLKEKITKKVKD